MRIFKIANVIGEQMVTFALALFFLFVGSQVGGFLEGIHFFMS